MEENTKKMLAGLPYRPDTEELSRISTKAHRLSRDYNQTADEDKEVRKAIIDELFPNHETGVYLQGPIEVDYGKFTKLGKNFYANFNLTILDTCPVTIGDNVMCGPNTSLVTPLHPLLPELGDNCWLASNVTVCPGVTIGKNCVIGAGSVVTKNIPDNSLVLGVPGRVVRKITEKDRLDNYPY